MSVGSTNDLCATLSLLCQKLLVSKFQLSDVLTIVESTDVYARTTKLVVCQRLPANFDAQRPLEVLAFLFVQP
jgi:hypothetical protein